MASLALGLYLGLASRQPANGAAAPPPSATPAAVTAADPRAVLLHWQDQGTPAGSLKAPILQLAVEEMAGQTKLDVGKLRQQVKLLPAADYNHISTSSCDDAADIRSNSEAWLLDVRQDKLYLNDGFTPTSAQSVVDLFFRYTIGLYNAAPVLKTYPNGSKTSDGTTAYYEKGLLLLGKQPVDRVLRRDCYLQYRKAIQEAFTADQALRQLDRMDLAPSPSYDYPQKASLEQWQASVAPKLGPAADTLLAPFLQTDSGELYRRVGRALGGNPGNPAATADALFRATFPA